MYSTPNLHLCSLKDFESLCEGSNIKISEKLIKASGENTFYQIFPNLFAEIAIYKLEKILKIVLPLEIPES